MSSDLVPTGMSDLDVYLSDRYTLKDDASQLTTSSGGAADIRRKCTYVRTKWYFPLLESNGPIAKGLTRPLGKPKADLGLFDNLPSDVMNNILVQLDIQSFRNFRNVNAAAHSITGTALDCKEVLEHGQSAFVSIIRAGLSRNITIGEIHLALTSSKCGFCEEYGPLLFLPTCTRVCHECLCTSPRTAMIGSEEILPFYTRFGMYRGHGNRSHLLKSLAKSSIASVRVRNHLRPDQMVKGIRGVLVDDLFWYCEELGIETTDAMRFLFENEWLQYRTAASINFPYLNTSTGELENGRSCRGCQEAFEEQSMQVMVPRATGRIYAGAADRDTVYSHAGFMKHFETCDHAQRVWESRALPGRESWFAANGGMLWGIEERAEYCQRARYISTAINIYQRVLRHAPDALNALRRTDLSSFVSYSDIYTALTTMKCAFCGQFGDFLFLPTAKRCCFECLRTSPETALVNKARISRREQWKGLYANHADALTNALKSKDIRTFKTHNWDDTKEMSKTRGVLAKDLLAIYIKFDSTMEEPGQALLKPGWLHYRLAASIIFPCLNIRTGRPKTGVSCIGCHLNIWKQIDASLIYLSSANILDEAAAHLSQCSEAQRIWLAGDKRVQCLFVQQGGIYHYRANEWRRDEENFAV
ncbi:hypothetical protein H9Q69_010116 [Fusarium xylarioides]|nr:hypothetical protein H9Q69_010116 [Fusarium xylarioides]